VKHLLAIGISLNTVMLVHNIVIDNTDMAFLNFACALAFFAVLARRQAADEAGRKDNDEQ
jgi:hypothetical protein